jgi:hypothetical protein
MAAKSLRGISQKSISLLDTTEAYLYLMRLSQSLMGPAGCNFYGVTSPYQVGNQGS